MASEARNPFYVFLARLLWVFTRRMAHWARHGLALALLALGFRLAVVPPLAPRRLALLAPALAAGPGPAAAEVAISPRQAADLRIQVPLEPTEPISAIGP